MKKFIAGFTVASVLGFGGIAFAERVSIPSVQNLQQVVNVAIDFLGLGITDAGPISGSTLTATSTSATSSVAYRLQVGSSTPMVGNNSPLSIVDTRELPTRKATTTLTIGNPNSTSTSMSGITMKSSAGSTTCVYVAGTSAPTLVVTPGACAN